ncbi:kinase-like protein [Exidia glandulosa HHB12029]|uniref:Kinase-like protein n=1 Tax=Exidia glandulosa HHB12029 TaxID=1314781 RepID=A0A165HD44_EXIGL|nr:kinase-like protein [Exidia glandulosa HHB12029]
MDAPQSIRLLSPSRAAHAMKAGSIVTVEGVNAHSDTRICMLPTLPGVRTQLGVDLDIGALVALKTRRSEPAQEASTSEISIWRRARHSKILPLLALHRGSAATVLVSPWLSQGTIAEYLVARPWANRRRLVFQVAQAVQFLHDILHVLHGKISCDTVLISQDCDAQLSDFSASRAAGDAVMANVEPKRIVNSANEGKNASQTNRTTAYDVYSFGWFIYQTYTDVSPKQLANNPAWRSMIGRGFIPEQPALMSLARMRGLDNALWCVCVSSWQLSPVARPRMREILVLIADTGDVISRDVVGASAVDVPSDRQRALHRNVVAVTARLSRAVLSFHTCFIVQRTLLKKLAFPTQLELVAQHLFGWSDDLYADWCRYLGIEHVAASRAIAKYSAALDIGNWKFQITYRLYAAYRRLLAVRLDVVSPHTIVIIWPTRSLQLENVVSLDGSRAAYVFLRRVTPDLDQPRDRITCSDARRRVRFARESTCSPSSTGNPWRSCSVPYDWTLWQCDSVLVVLVGVLVDRNGSKRRACAVLECHRVASLRCTADGYATSAASGNSLQSHYPWLETAWAVALASHHIGAQVAPDPTRDALQNTSLRWDTHRE